MCFDSRLQQEGWRRNVSHWFKASRTQAVKGVCEFRRVAEGSLSLESQSAVGMRCPSVTQLIQCCLLHLLSAVSERKDKYPGRRRRHPQGVSYRVSWMLAFQICSILVWFQGFPHTWGKKTTAVLEMSKLSGILFHPSKPYHFSEAGAWEVGCSAASHPHFSVSFVSGSMDMFFWPCQLKLGRFWSMWSK